MNCQDGFSIQQQPQRLLQVQPNGFFLGGLTVIQLLGQGKVAVYLVFCPMTNSVFAMKVFPFCNDFFLNETRFTSLQHQNVIFPITCQKKANYIEGLQVQWASIILMEYAPKGTFFQALIKNKLRFDEKLMRTYFYQLMDVVEYLHSKNVAHMDLKLENLMFGNDFELKLIDFDLAYIKNDEHILGTGTRCYRAPEVAIEKCEDPFAADIYSAGIILFVFKSGKTFPHCEYHKFKDINLLELLHFDPDKFWEAHANIQNKPLDFWSDDFKKLFCGMTCVQPDKRYKLEDVKNNGWYKGDIYTNDEMKVMMSELFAKMNENGGDEKN